MPLEQRSRMALIVVGLAAGVVQIAAGVAMYVCGVYFARWSMIVSLVVLLVCIIVGTRWYATNCLNGKITYGQAAGAGIAISVATGVCYAVYNIVSISYFYPHFIDDMMQAAIARAAAVPAAQAALAAAQGEITASSIAIGNCLRLSVLGAVLSLITARSSRAESSGLQ
jgi:hypothetical protein